MKNLEIQEKFKHMLNNQSPFVAEIKAFGKEGGMHITFAQSVASERELARAAMFGTSISGSLRQYTRFNVTKPEAIAFFTEAFENNRHLEDFTIVVEHKVLELRNGAIPKSFLDAEGKLREPIKIDDTYLATEDGKLIYRSTELLPKGMFEDNLIKTTKRISKAEMLAIQSNITGSVSKVTATEGVKEDLPA
jgi:hypothetical protein